MIQKSIRQFASAILMAAFCLIAIRVSCGGSFHGLNAGAPIWNGNIELTPQRAQQFAATGTKAIRVNFRLDNGATTWNAMQLSMYDEVINNARNAGLNVLGLFSNETVAGGQAAWNNDPDNDGLNNYVAQYASTAQFLVSRYGSQIKTWELWNEPNAYTNPNYVNEPQNAGGTYILPRVYARMLSETYRSLSSANLLEPLGTKLVSGGLLAHDIGGSFSTAMDYMQQVYGRNSIWNAMQTDFGRRYPWDEFGYHFYISQGSLLQTSELASYFNAVRSTQIANNDTSKINVTEFGWQTVGSNTQELQRANMATTYAYLESRPDVAGTYWYQWIDEPGGNWGIVNSSGQPKLSYHEFAAQNAASPDPDPDPPSNNIIFTTHHAAIDTALAYTYSSSDLIQGKIATELPGDRGWHPDNPAYEVPTNRNGLKAFTDGVGAYNVGTTGLLADFPPAGLPTKLIDYDLGGAHDIDEIRIFTGNAGADGRVFSTTAVWSSSNGVDFDFLGYFQSDPSGTFNNGSTPGGAKGAIVVRILREDGSPLAEAATQLRFHFFAVSSLEAQMRDPFDGTNAFTGVDDGLPAAYMSPMVREIDVFGTFVGPPVLAGDFSGDGLINATDYVVWRKTVGTEDGYQAWRANFGRSAGPGGQGQTLPVPEPGSFMLLSMALAVFSIRTRFVDPESSRRLTPLILGADATRPAVWVAP